MHNVVSEVAAEMTRPYLITLRTLDESGTPQGLIESWTVPAQEAGDVADRMSKKAFQEREDLWVISIYAGDSDTDQFLGACTNRTPDDWGKDGCHWELVEESGDRKAYVHKAVAEPRTVAFDMGQLRPELRKALRDKLIASANSIYPEGQHASLDKAIEDLHDLDAEGFTVSAQKVRVAKSFAEELRTADRHAFESHGKSWWYEDDCASLHVLRAATLFVAEYMSLVLEG